VSIDTRSVQTLTLDKAVKRFVRTNSYAHYAVQYTLTPDLASLVADLYVDRDLRTDILLYANAFGLAGSDEHCYGSSSLPCQTRFDVFDIADRTALDSEEQRETCMIELKACDLIPGTNNLYLSVYPDLNRPASRSHGYSSTTVHGDQSIEFTLIVTKKIAETYTFDPNAQFDAQSDHRGLAYLWSSVQVRKLW